MHSTRVVSPWRAVAVGACPMSRTCSTALTERRVDLGQTAVKPGLPGVGIGPISRIGEIDKAPISYAHIDQAISVEKQRRLAARFELWCTVRRPLLVNTGRHLLNSSSSVFDPRRTFVRSALRSRSAVTGIEFGLHPQFREPSSYSAVGLNTAAFGRCRRKPSLCRSKLWQDTSWI